MVPVRALAAWAVAQFSGATFRALELLKSMVGILEMPDPPG
jgi:hypothetical protein